MCSWLWHNSVSVNKWTTAGTGIGSPVAPVWYLRYFFPTPRWIPKPIFFKSSTRIYCDDRHGESWSVRCISLLCLPLCRQLSATCRHCTSLRWCPVCWRRMPAACLLSMEHCTIRSFSDDLDNPTGSLIDGYWTFLTDHQIGATNLPRDTSCTTEGMHILCV